MSGGRLVMDLALPCDPGCEPVLNLEVEELLGRKAVARTGYVIVRECSLEEAATLCLLSRAATRVLALIAEGSARSAGEVAAHPALRSFHYEPFTSGAPFRVSCERHGSQSFRAREVEEAVGAFLHEERGWPVSLSSPRLTISCMVRDSRFLIGVDLAGRDLGRRPYKVFHGRRSLRPAIAYAAARLAGFSGKELLLDPNPLDGAILIESALFALGRSPRGSERSFTFLGMPAAGGADWDSFFAAREREEERRMGLADPAGLAAGAAGMLVARPPHGYAAKLLKAHARLAGVDSLITIQECSEAQESVGEARGDGAAGAGREERGRLGVLGEAALAAGSGASGVGAGGSAPAGRGGGEPGERPSLVDLIVSHPLVQGRKTPLRLAEESHEDLFSLARRVLSPRGAILLVAEKAAGLRNAADRHGFTLLEERPVLMGEARLLFLRFGRP